MVAAGSTVVSIGTILFMMAVAATVVRAVRRGVRSMRGSLVVRDGRAALSDEARARLEKRHIDVTKIERLLAQTYTVDGRGKIVLQGESSETKAPASPTSRTAPPTSRTAPAAKEPDRPLYRKPSVEDLLGGRSRLRK
jgi:hypothetical protein